MQYLKTIYQWKQSNATEFVCILLIFVLCVFLVRWLSLKILQKIKSLTFRKKDKQGFKFKGFDSKPFFLLKNKNILNQLFLFFKSNIGLWACLKTIFSNEDQKLKMFHSYNFLGRTADKKAFYVDQSQRATHFQVIGRTGSGKSASIIRNMIYQDIQKGYGVIVIDAKGASDFRKEMVGMCVEAGRSKDIRVFNLGDIDNSHSYNPFHISSGVTPGSIADRFFAATVTDKNEIMKNYYLKQQACVLRLIVEILHGTGQPFNARDIYHLLLDPKSILKYAQTSQAKNAYAEFIQMQDMLGREFVPTLSGLIERIQVFSKNKALNSKQPDIMMDDIFEKGRVLYCQLPTGSNPLLSKDIARILFQDIEYETSLREIGMNRSKEKFIAVYADEFYEWTYPEIVGAIGKARSGNVSWLVAHQSMSDLSRLGDAFWQGIWDNTSNKLILEQTDPILNDFVSKSLGTQKIEKSTWRSSRELGLQQDEGEQSNRIADELRFSPNNLKNLHAYGQGFYLQRNKFVALNFGLFQIKKHDIKINPKGDTI